MDFLQPLTSYPDLNCFRFGIVFWAGGVSWIVWYISSACLLLNSVSEFEHRVDPESKWEATKRNPVLPRKEIMSKYICHENLSLSLKSFMSLWLWLSVKRLMYWKSPQISQVEDAQSAFYLCTLIETFSMLTLIMILAD